MTDNKKITDQMLKEELEKTIQFTDETLKELEEIGKALHEDK